MNTINEFLVSLGFQVRESELAQVESSLKRVMGFAAKLGAALVAAEKAIQAVVISTSVSLDRLAYSADRLGTSADNLQSVAYALRQMGQNNPSGVLSNFAERLRTVPNTERVLQGLGVTTRAGGKMRDTADLFREAIKGLNANPDYTVATSTADLLGISEPDYYLLRKGGKEFEEREAERRRIYQGFGVDPNQAASQSRSLAIGWRTALMGWETLLTKVAIEIQPTLIENIESLGAWMERNQSAIVDACKRLLDVVAAMGRGMLDFIRALDPAADAFLAFATANDKNGGFADAAETISPETSAKHARGFLDPLSAVLEGLEWFVGLFTGKRPSATPTIGGSSAKAPVAAGMLGGGGGSSPAAGEARGGWFSRIFGGGRSRAMGGAGAAGAASGGGKWEGPIPAPASEPDSALADDRRKFAEEMKDPAVAARFAAFVQAEVGGQGPKAQQAFIETIFNRASSRGQTLRQTLSGDYFPSVTHSRAAALARDPRIAEKYGALFGAAMAGSNISGFATGNASGTVGFAGGPQTSSYNGERFGVEGPDIRWARRMQEISRARLTPPPPLPPKMDMPGFDPNSMFDAPPLGAIGPSSSIRGRQETVIVVQGDPDPSRTAAQVSAAQIKVDRATLDRASQLV